MTESGWRLGRDVSVGDQIAAWEPVTGSIALETVEEKFLAPYSGPMRVLRNADTDQLVTPNHRVYHRRRRRKQEDGVRRAWFPAEWDVCEARSLTRWEPTKLPVSGFADGPGIGGVAYAELLAFVWTEGSLDRTGQGVRIYQSPSANAATAKRVSRLVARLVPHAKRYDRERIYKSRVTGPVLSAESCWFFTGEMAERVRRDLPGKMPTYELLWQMSLVEKVAFLDAAMAGDGSGLQFEQKGREPLEWFQTLAHLIGLSARVRMRSNRDTGVCSLRGSSTTEMQNRHFKAAHDAHYDGDVWCVRVATGAFLARRNGLVFITGNSGFPKALDASKAIDKKLGAERTTVIGHRDSGLDKGSGVSVSFAGASGRDETGLLPMTAPETAAAAAWEGWATGLKPAHEPVVVARKPLVGSVAANVLAHGVGALNIEAAWAGRAGGTRQTKAKDGATGREVTTFGASLGSASGGNEDAGGRWPANVALLHLPACKGSGPDHTDVLCAKGCPVALLNEQSGKSRGIRGELTSKPGHVYGGGDGLPSHTGLYGYDDSGGAARFFYVAKPRTRERIAGTTRNLHPTCKPVELMRYLIRLVTPLGGVVLDPFLGSGSTGCAAMVEGIGFVGIERDPDYFETARARIADWAFAHGRPRPLAS